MRNIVVRKRLQSSGRTHPQHANAEHAALAEGCRTSKTTYSAWMSAVRRGALLSSVTTRSDAAPRDPEVRHQLHQRAPRVDDVLHLERRS